MLKHKKTGNRLDSVISSLEVTVSAAFSPREAMEGRLMTKLEFIFSIFIIVVIIWLWNTTAKYDGLNVQSFFPVISPLKEFFIVP